MWKAWDANAIDDCGEPSREKHLNRLFVIRRSEFGGGPGESHPKAALSYPYAIERGGSLYGGYSNSGGGMGRKGTGRELWNNNSAELAVIPLSGLRGRD